MKLSTLTYQDTAEKRTLDVPKSDILYQFRKDVNEGKLPAVSYLAAPQNFSDHPSAPWYGAWYVSETLDILTKNPEVWKKTIFILCYDENDGYYDHQPPFSIPNPFKENSGKVSEGIDLKVEYVTLEQDQSQVSKTSAREGAIGLGFRVPLVVASPWSRGGKVCSQVFDHTSIIQFLEEFTSHKAKKEIRETNISEWRRTICGNISTVFQPYDPSTYTKPKPVNRDEIVTTIHKAQFKEVPANFKPLTDGEISQINLDPAPPFLPAQEPGTRSSCAIPYELSASGKLEKDTGVFEVNLAAENRVFGKRSAGSPFIIYALEPYQKEKLKVWNYAVKAGDNLIDRWNVSDFEGGRYHLRVYGPNGFYREFAGSARDNDIDIDCNYVLDKKGKPTGDIRLLVVNHEKSDLQITIADNAYQQKAIGLKVAAGESETLLVSLFKSRGWYDFDIKIGMASTFKRFAGHVETGKESITDPFMGRVTGAS